VEISVRERFQQITVVALGLVASSLCQGAELKTLHGFTQEHAETEKALETRFDAGLSAEAIKERLRRMSSEPNHVGSPHNKENAEFTLEQFKSWGWDARIEVFDMLYPTPEMQLLELISPSRFKATLTEPPIPGDASSFRSKVGLPAYAGFGGEGDVTASLVYVNYGMVEDYETLKRLGVDVKGKIVIARYGDDWRGLKPKLAQEHGALGCIIYSDPQQDGYGAGLPYPKGGFRPEHAIQRGSVLDMPVRPGDPLTRDSKLIMSIPVIPISWGDAQHFLKALEGPIAPEGWRGGLGITYRVGPGKAVAHLVVKSKWEKRPLYNVIAFMKGSTSPDQWVIRGNHRDGWVFGAMDPLSAHSVLMEEAKSLGALFKSGFRPKRTLVYASWDGEEVGLIGSTKWAEAHADELRSKAVVYINTDDYERGFLSAGASYSLQHLFNEVSDDVSDPETKVSMLRRAKASLQVSALSNDAKDDVKMVAKKVGSGGPLPVHDLGSGSDFTPFVQHLGIASMYLMLGGEGEYGAYHSAYDTFEHFARFGDPTFAYGVALAQSAGRLVLRMANADILPFHFEELADKIADQVDSLKKLAISQKESDETMNRLLDEKAFDLAADPQKPWGVPDRKTASLPLDFTKLESVVAQLAVSAKAFDKAAHLATLTPEKLTQLNQLLKDVERTLTDDRGLPGRPWFRHLIYAPGLLSGYGAKVLPGVREAIEGRRWNEASELSDRTAKALEAASAKLNACTSVLSKP
jgi:N-acetylated-alpha-linked acidic dipeptidase